MTDTLTVCDTPISKDQIHAVAARLREGGHDKSDDEIETAGAIGLKHMSGECPRARSASARDRSSPVAARATGSHHG